MVNLGVNPKIGDETIFKLQADNTVMLAELTFLRKQVAELEDRLEAVSTESVVQRITIAELEAEIATANQDWHNINTENNTLSLQVVELESDSMPKFIEHGGDDEPDLIERLRFFCSLALKTEKDWLDVEKLFDDLISERNALSLQVAELREVKP